MHFDIPKKNFNPKIENFYSYALRFAVSKVERRIKFRLLTNAMKVYKFANLWAHMVLFSLIYQ
jgi:hypothetical protein